MILVNDGDKKVVDFFGISEGKVGVVENIVEGVIGYDYDNEVLDYNGKKYKIKDDSRSWCICYDESVKEEEFECNEDELVLLYGMDDYGRVGCIEGIVVRNDVVLFWMDVYNEGLVFEVEEIVE